MGNVVRLFGQANPGTDRKEENVQPMSTASSAGQKQPLLSDGQVAFAHLQTAQFDLEKAIASLVKESDGGAKSIPKFKDALGTIALWLPKLQP